ncbi:MAG: C45 family peptidase [Lachnospiraceae bacterium]|nr:C45 family peptidase [Lachnospiraceae bacterium]
MNRRIIRYTVPVISFLIMFMGCLPLTGSMTGSPVVVLAAENEDTCNKCITVSDESLSFEDGQKVAKGDIKIVNLRGTWREMGRQYGNLMKEELEDVKAFLDTIIEANKGNTANTKEIVDQQVAQTPHRIKEFFEGAAETSGMTVRDLQTINAVERIGGLPKCSVAMAWGDYAESDLIIGRNYDYSDFFSLLKDDIAVTVYHPADGSLATATIGYVGEIYAVNGMNEKGIFLELNNGKPSANIKSPNFRVTGTTMLFECLFEIDELSDMNTFFNTVNCSSSYIINVADENEGQSFEWCPIGVKHGEEDLDNGLLVSTNHFVNPEWLFAMPSEDKSWESQTRRNNLISLCEKDKGKINEAKMKEIIDTTIQNGGAKNDLTVYQMVVVPKDKTLWLQITGGSEWTEIDLKSFLDS